MTDRAKLDMILMKLDITDGDLNVLDNEERGILIALLDKYCEGVGIVPVDVNGGIDIYVN